jgi:predicted molibdopterin-dependent oxidoreductase YjgC
MPNLPRVRAALERADLVIVQDAYDPTETGAFADVLLPAAVNLEQCGTFCNSERRVTLMEQVVEPPGDARPDWWWPRQVADAMGFRSGMRYDRAADIFDEFARVTAGRPNDQSALSHAVLRAKGPLQWPCPALGRPSARRYTDGHFPMPSGRARFFARPWTPPDESPDERFPFILNTGRVAGQWHTRTKTGLVEELNKLDSAPYVRMNPADAERLGLRDGQFIEVESSRGCSNGVLRLDASIATGSVFMPIHWNDLWAHHASPNEATTSATDPISRQPALKISAVSIRPRFPSASAGSVKSASRPAMAR